MVCIPWDEREPGHLETDLVHHCGATAWSERAAVLGRSYLVMEFARWLGDRTDWPHQLLPQNLTVAFCTMLSSGQGEVHCAEALVPLLQRETSPADGPRKSPGPLLRSQMPSPRLITGGLLFEGLTGRSTTPGSPTSKPRSRMGCGKRTKVACSCWLSQPLRSVHPV